MFFIQVTCALVPTKLSSVWKDGNDSDAQCHRSFPYKSKGLASVRFCRNELQHHVRMCPAVS